MLGKKKVISIGMALLLLVGVAGCGKKTATTSGDVAVKSMKVIRRDTPITYDYTGFVEAANDVEIKSKVTGTIVQKLVNGGDYVEAGQLLYVIDPRTYQNSVLNAQANLANAEATLANAQKDAQRYQTLYEQGAVSKQTADQYNTALAQAQASVDAQQAIVASSQVDVSDTQIVAPFSGKLSTNTLANGAFVTANSTVLTSISGSDPMRVRFSVSQGDYLDIMQGNTKRYRQPGGPERKRHHRYPDSESRIPQPQRHAAAGHVCQSDRDRIHGAERHPGSPAGRDGCDVQTLRLCNQR